MTEIYRITSDCLLILLLSFKPTSPGVINHFAAEHKLILCYRNESAVKQGLLTKLIIVVTRVNQSLSKVDL